VGRFIHLEDGRIAIRGVEIGLHFGPIVFAVFARDLR
jgi:hypothetical protein